MQEFPFDKIFLDPCPELRSSITNHGALSLIRAELVSIRQRKPDLNLAELLDECIKSERLDALLLLLDKGVRPYGWAAVTAALSGKLEFIAPLIEHGWQINERPTNDAPPIICYMMAHEDAVAWLLARGADPNMTSRYGDTPLSHAVEKGSLVTIHMLLDAGADVTQGDPLHAASRRKETKDTAEIIHLLISRGAPVDQTEHQSAEWYMIKDVFPNGTPLHTACYGENFVAAKAFLEHGASPSHPKRRLLREEPITPLDDAKNTGNNDMIELLLTYNKAKL